MENFEGQCPFLEICMSYNQNNSNFYKSFQRNIKNKKIFFAKWDQYDTGQIYLIKLCKICQSVKNGEVWYRTGKTKN